MKQKVDSKLLKNSLTKQKGKIILLIVIALFFAVNLILLAIFAKNILDIATNGKEGSLQLNALFIFIIILLQTIGTILTNSIKNSVVISGECTLKNSVFKNLLSSNYKYIFPFHTGELLNQLNSDVHVVINNYVNTLLRIVNFTVRIILGVGILLLFSKLFTLLYIGLTALLFACGRLLSKPFKKAHLQTQICDDKIKSLFTESLDKTDIIKAYDYTDKTIDKLCLAEKDYLIAQKKKILLSNFVTAGMYLIATIGYYATLVYGAFMLSGSTMSYGDLTAMLLIVTQIQAPLKGITGLTQQISEISASMQRINKLSDFNKDKTELLPENFINLKAENINFTYDEAPVLQNFNFEINKGEIVGISGSSGAGKTTFFKILLGLYAQNSGKITVKTDFCDHLLDESLRGYFAYVPQGNKLFSGSIKSNIDLNNNLDDMQINDILKAVIMDDFVASLPNGADSVIGQNGVGISEGQAQRIAVGRAIASGRQILLLDEFTSSLDEETESKLIKNLKDLHLTCIIISHRKETLNICDRIYRT